MSPWRSCCHQEQLGAALRAKQLSRAEPGRDERALFWQAGRRDGPSWALPRQPGAGRGVPALHPLRLGSDISRREPGSSSAIAMVSRSILSPVSNTAALGARVKGSSHYRSSCGYFSPVPLGSKEKKTAFLLLFSATSAVMNWAYKTLCRRLFLLHLISFHSQEHFSHQSLQISDTP